ncbi:hypothetical protein RUW55_14835, partial [Escherichia coli]|nr:hypothetical protein [Escherichia coli]MDW2505659.1 hypothetical protein [Escherichia coli]
MLYMLLCCFLMLNSTFVMFRAMSAISKGSAKENRSEISLIVLATLGIASPFIVAMITINESMTSKTVTDFSLGAQWYWICPYISRHLLSLNPLLACCRRYSR